MSSSAEAENPQAPAECKSSTMQFRWWWRYSWFCWRYWSSEYAFTFVFISVRQGDIEVGSLYLAVYHSVFLLTRLLKTCGWILKWNVGRSSSSLPLS